MTKPLISLVLLLAFPVLGQESASFKLTDQVFNAAGHPADGIVLTSANYRITLGAIGESVVGRDLSSASYQMDGSFVMGSSPPGEVEGLFFADPQTLVWTAERSIGDYNLYRDLMGNLSGLDYGTCEQQNIDNSTTTVSDSLELNPGEGYFYLVTAENRLREEGTKGWVDGSVERQGTTCP